MSCEPRTPIASEKVAFLKASVYMSSLEATTFSSVMPLMIGPMVTICAISSERAALPSRQRTEFANIRWRTLCTMRAIRTAMGSKAFILRMTPPKAPTQSIIAMDQPPASENPV